VFICREGFHRARPCISPQHHVAARIQNNHKHINAAVFNKSAGMTLLECIIAVFLITMAFASILSVYPLLYRQSTQSRNKFIAVAVANGLLEAVRAYSYNAPLPPELKKPREYEQVIEGVRTKVVYTVKSIDFEPSNPSGKGPDPKSYTCRVKVVIEWEEGTGASSSMKRETFTATGTKSR